MFTNIIVGIITGIISSCLVSCYFARKEYERQFNIDKQNYIKYIRLLKTAIKFRKGNANFVMQIIENEPYREAFKNLPKKSVNITNSIKKCIDEINVKIKSNKFNQNDINYYDKKLNKFITKATEISLK